MLTRLLLAICTTIFWSTYVLAQETDFAGSVKSLEGTVTILRANTKLSVSQGLHILAKDRIVTAPKSRVALMLRDGTRISIGPNSEFSVTNFEYNPQAGAFSLLMNLVQGALVYVSGKIASFAPASVSLETPSGTVGLRGTEFAITLEQ